jgi:hypothetical protein
MIKNVRVSTDTSAIACPERNASELSDRDGSIFDFKLIWKKIRQSSPPTLSKDKLREVRFNECDSSTIQCTAATILLREFPYRPICSQGWERVFIFRWSVRCGWSGTGRYVSRWVFPPRYISSHLELRRCKCFWLTSIDILMSLEQQHGSLIQFP